MSILSAIGNYAADFRQRRLRARTYLEITSLPPEIQKDIGWPDGYRHDTAADRSRVRLSR